MEALTSDNERMKSELRSLNEINENQSVVNKGVHLTSSEAIHRLFVRGNDVETLSVDEQTGLILEARNRYISDQTDTEDG